MASPVTTHKPASLSGRLISLDVFRGATIAAMILVNNPGNDFAYAPLQHAKWSGWTPTDLIFPFFLFIVGVSLWLSFRSRLERGASKRSLLLHSLRRSVILFAIGVFLNGFPRFQLANWRIPGVLQRIAVAYLAAALITLRWKTKGIVIWIVGLLASYWILVRFVPVPGYGMPVRDVPFLHPDMNLASYLDRLVIPGRLYEGTRDPEGILSTIPAIATALFGALTGQWLASGRDALRKALGMLGAGVALVLAGELWNLWFPINKKMWTSSYVLFAAGAALIAVAVCYWFLDVKQQRWWSKPFLIFGTNAIAVYVLADLLSGVLGAIRVQAGRRTIPLQDYLYRHWFAAWGTPAQTSLSYSVVFVAVCFLPIWWMYRKKIFLKV